MASSPAEARRTVLLTRPLEDSRATARLLAADGIDCEIWPLTAIRPLAFALALPPTVDGLLITSAHGARAFAALSARRDLPALCVGEATARVARRLGFAGAVSAGGDAAALARLAAGTGLRHFFHPRGRETAADLPGLLARGGQRVSEAVLYAAEETGPPPAPVAAGLRSGRIGIAAVWSRRNAAIFVRHLERAGIAFAPDLVAVAISAAAAEPLRAAGLARVAIAAEPSGAAMLAAIRAAA